MSDSCVAPVRCRRRHSKILSISIGRPVVSPLTEAESGKTTLPLISVTRILKPRDFGTSLRKIVWRCLYNGSRMEETLAFMVS